MKKAMRALTSALSLSFKSGAVAASLVMLPSAKILTV